MKKVAVVTGASNGIGKAVAVDLAAQDYFVVLLARSKESLESVFSLIKQAGGSGCYYVLDVADHDGVKSCIDDVISKYCRIDFLINNAGIWRPGTLDMDTAEIEEIISINLLGAIYIAKYVGVFMKKQGFGYIMNIASMSGKRALPFSGVYAASKFGLVGFSESLFKNLAEYGVKVTAICPGPVDTDMLKDSKFDLNSMIKVEDIVQSVNYLLKLSDSVSMPELIMRCTASVAYDSNIIRDKHF